MKNTVRILTALLLAVLLCAALIACGHDDTEHVAAGEWQIDATHHWKACEDGCEGAQVDKAEHTFDNACDVDCNDGCGYVRVITHSPESALTHDETSHWYKCSVLNGTQILRPPKVLGPGVSHRLRDRELILFADLPCQYHRLDVPRPFVSRGPLTVEETPRVQGGTQPPRLLLAEDSEEEVGKFVYQEGG